MGSKKTDDLVTVAIVEDDAGLRSSLIRMLALTGEFRCVGQFPTAETALERIPDLRPKVVLMDINLPGMDGVECVRRLSQEAPSSHILMLTVYKDTVSIFRALAAGAVGYLLKPVRSAELLQAVKDAAAGGAPMTSNIARLVVESFRAGPSSDSEMEQLTEREAEVLKLLASGYLYKEISNELKVSMGTINTLVHRIYKKLHVHSRHQAIALYKERH